MQACSYFSRGGEGDERAPPHACGRRPLRLIAVASRRTGTREGTFPEGAVGPTPRLVAVQTPSQSVIVSLVGICQRDNVPMPRIRHLVAPALPTPPTHMGCLRHLCRVLVAGPCHASRNAPRGTTGRGGGRRGISSHPRTFPTGRATSPPIADRTGRSTDRHTMRGRRGDASWRPPPPSPPSRRLPSSPQACPTQGGSRTGSRSPPSRASRGWRVRHAPSRAPCPSHPTRRFPRPAGCGGCAGHSEPPLGW